MRVAVLLVCVGALVVGCGGTSSPDVGDASTDAVVSPADTGTEVARDADTDFADAERGSAHADVREAGVDAVDTNIPPSCSPSAGFFCIYGSCLNDVGAYPVCQDGAWTCPSGAIDVRTCHGCVGNFPPGCTCREGVVTCTDGGAPRD